MSRTEHAPVRGARERVRPARRTAGPHDTDVGERDAVRGRLDRYADAGRCSDARVSVRTRSLASQSSTRTEDKVRPSAVAAHGRVVHGDVARDGPGVRVRHGGDREQQERAESESSGRSHRVLCARGGALCRRLVRRDFIHPPGKNLGDKLERRTTARNLT